MKKKIILTLISCLGFLNGFAVNGFYMEFKISSTSAANMNGSMKIYFSEEGNSRSEINITIPQMPGGGINIVSLSKKEEPTVTYLIHDDTKSFTKSVRKTTAAGALPTHYEITILGNEKVNNYNCVHVKIKANGNEEQELWTSKEIPEGMDQYAATGNRYLPDEQLTREMKAKGADGMVVRIVKTEKGNKMQIDLVKAEKRDFPSSTFMIPDDYKESTTTPSAIKGMPSQQELMNMSPEEREKFIKQMQENYKNGNQ